MSKSTGLLKRMSALFLVVLMSINTFAALVGDNDGAAFITKAEFDSMKNDFQSQLDRYNSSIDNKIDGAIAAYLAGLRISKKVKIDLDKSNDWDFPVWINDGANKWNDNVSQFYSCSNPQINTYQTSLWYDSSGGDPTSWQRTMTKWNETFSVSKATATVSREGWSWHKNAIPGENGIICEVTKTTENRTLGTETLRIYDCNNIGTGYKLVYWVSDNPLIQGYSGGSYTYLGNFEYGAILGKENGNKNKYISTSEEIRPNHIAATIVAGWSSRFTDSDYKTTFPTGNNRTTQYLTANNVRSWKNTEGGAQSYLNINELCTSAQFVWNNNKRNLCYIENANMPAETKSDFCYKAYLPSTTTVYRYLSLEDVGWKYSHGHSTAGNYTAGAFTAYSPIVVPYFYAARSSSWTTNNYFSYLPAKQVRYKTSDGDIHFMDEGFFMLKVDRNGTLQFDIKFIAYDSTSNTIDVSFAKAPFNNAFKNADLLYTKINDGTQKIVNQVTTGVKVSVEIQDIEKDTPIYLKWENAGTTDKKQVGLSSLDNMYLITDG